MNPLAIGALLSFAPGLFGHLFGNDPQQAYRRAVAKLLSQRPELVNKLYQQVLGSPAYSQAQGSIAAGANQSSNQLAANLGARGIGTSGTGAVLSSLVPSLVGSQQSQLRTAGYQTASTQADQDIQAQLASLTGMQNPGQTAQLFSGGLSAFAPLLAQWLKSKYPTPTTQTTASY